MQSSETLTRILDAIHDPSTDFEKALLSVLADEYAQGVRDGIASERSKHPQQPPPIILFKL